MSAPGDVARIAAALPDADIVGTRDYAEIVPGTDR
jgi:hypothetical protein